MPALRMVSRRGRFEFDPEILKTAQTRLEKATPDDQMTVLTLLEHPKIMDAVERFINAFQPDGLE